MDNLNFRKIVALSFLFSGLTADLLSSDPKKIYTVEQAQQCFHSQALPFCEDKINDCIMNKQCEKDLHFYRDCNFQKEYTNQVFNGNCFKDWKNTAKASKQVINCIDSQCNLAGYNSEVSLKILYTCVSQALIQQNVECNDVCQQILQEKISKKIPYEPINDIYGKIEKNDVKNNESVQKLIEIIKKECIDENGGIRKRHEKDLLEKKINKQKIIDKMNEKNNDEAGLKQNQKKNSTKVGDEDL